jgi:hypothetical protein
MSALLDHSKRKSRPHLRLTGTVPLSGNHPKISRPKPGIGIEKARRVREVDGVSNFLGFGGRQSCGAMFCATSAGHRDMSTVSTLAGGGQIGVWRGRGSASGVRFTAAGLGKADAPIISTPNQNLQPLVPASNAPQPCANVDST